MADRKTIHENNTNQAHYASRDSIKNLMLSKKFKQYFFPSIITAVAMSLSEFVDGMVVSNLLDATALAIINVCVPLMTLMAAVYLLFGGGGSICYSDALGHMNEKKAGEILSSTVLASLLIGLVMMIAGQIFLTQLGNLLCPGLILGDGLLAYIRILLISMPFLITVNTVLIYLPAAGSPKLAMTLNIVANVLNLILDVVYIRVFDLGVGGAALATVTSFVVAGLVVLVLLKKTHLHFERPLFSHLKDVVKKGLATSLTQVGFSVKFAFCNSLASIHGGSGGLIAFSLCIQTLSIISIVNYGIADASRPLISFLRSKEDVKGVRYILSKAIKVSLITSMIFTLYLEIFPESIAAMFNATDPEILKIAIPALRIFSLNYLFRSVCIAFMLYTSIIGLTAYSTYISLFDGVVGIVAIAFVLCRLFGLSGVWLTFPVDAALLFVSIIVINGYLKTKYPDRFEDILLIEKSNPNLHILDISLESENKTISALSQDVIRFCKDHGASESAANRIGLCAEEMAVYTRAHEKEDEWLNLMLKIEGDSAVLDFRSLGTPFDLKTMTDSDLEENFKTLRAVAPTFEYTNTMGMNCTQFLFSLS